MSILFFLPLTVIALFESQIAHPRSRRIQLYFDSNIETEDDPKTEDPSCDDDAEGEISKVKFEDLVKAFPKCVHPSILPSSRSDKDGAEHVCSTAITESAVVHREMKALREKVEQLERVLRECTPFPEDKGDKRQD